MTFIHHLVVAVLGFIIAFYIITTSLFAFEYRSIVERPGSFCHANGYVLDRQ